MGFIRRYGDFPAFFVPDEGEVVLVARSHAGPFCLAYVVKVRRASRGMIRIDFVWGETREHSPWGVPPEAGSKGNVYISEDDAAPLIRRVPRGYVPHNPPPPEQGGGQGSAQV